MKEYLIVKRAKEWHVVVEGKKCGILRCEERAPLVKTACRTAAAVHGAVQVFDQQNRLEVRLSFQAGSLAVDGHYDGELDFIAANEEVRQA